MSNEKKTLVSEIRISYAPKVRPSERPTIRTSKDTYELLIEHWDKELIYFREEFKFLALNRGGRVIGIYPLSIGGLTETLVDLRLIFSIALGVLATSIILAHNHPGGGLTPSQEDQDLTKRIKAAGEIIRIKVLDHLIVTPESYFSFVDSGMM